MLLRLRVVLKCYCFIILGVWGERLGLLGDFVVWLAFEGMVILCWSWRSNQLMFPDLLSAFWPRKAIPLLGRCAWDKEDCSEGGEQKGPKHCEWRVREAELGGPRCPSVSAWPHCTAMHGQAALWEIIIATTCSAAQLVPAFQGPVMGLGVLFWVTQCHCSAMVEHSSWLTHLKFSKRGGFPSWLHRSSLGCCLSWHKVC